VRGTWLILALLVLAPSLSQAQDAPASPLAQAVAPPQSSQEAEDTATVKAAYEAYHQGGFGALADHLAKLQEVLDRAPRNFRFIDDGPTEVVYRGLGLPDYLVFSAAMQQQWKSKGQSPKPIVWRPSPYPDASLLVGSYYNEAQQWGLALAVLQRGLSLAPTDPALVTEAGMSLSQLRRFDQALQLYDQILSEELFLSVGDRARILRAKGFALTELGKLDAAEQAYNDSLKLDPDHLGAKKELANIAHLRAGAPPTTSVLSTTDKSRKGDY